MLNQNNTRTHKDVDNDFFPLAKCSTICPPPTTAEPSHCVVPHVAFLRRPCHNHKSISEPLVGIQVDAVLEFLVRQQYTSPSPKCNISVRRRLESHHLHQVLCICLAWGFAFPDSLRFLVQHEVLRVSFLHHPVTLVLLVGSIVLHTWLLRVALHRLVWIQNRTWNPAMMSGLSHNTCLIARVAGELLLEGVSQVFQQSLDTWQATVSNCPVRQFLLRLLHSFFDGLVVALDSVRVGTKRQVSILERMMPGGDIQTVLIFR